MIYLADFEKSLNVSERFKETSAETQEHILIEIKYQRKQMLMFFIEILYEIHNGEETMNGALERLITEIKKYN